MKPWVEIWLGPEEGPIQLKAEDVPRQGDVITLEVEDGTDASNKTKIWNVDFVITKVRWFHCKDSNFLFGPVIYAAPEDVTEHSVRHCNECGTIKIFDPVKWKVWSNEYRTEIVCEECSTKQDEGLSLESRWGKPFRVGSTFQE